MDLFAHIAPQPPSQGESHLNRTNENGNCAMNMCGEMNRADELSASGKKEEQ
jgi:hypothetical protein